MIPRRRVAAAATLAWPALALLVLLGVWELYADLGSVDALILPAPHEVAVALWDDWGLLWDNLVVTGEEVLLGVAFALVAGALLAAVLHLVPPLRRAVYPLLVASQTIPIPVIAPLLIVWLGFGLGPKLLIIGLICFFPVVVATLDGLARVDPDLLKLTRTLDAPRLRTFRLVEAPAALPSLFSGMKIAVAIAVIAAIFGEQSGAQDGIGVLLQQATPQLLTARAYAAVVLLSAFALLLFGLFALLERRTLPPDPGASPL